MNPDATTAPDPSGTVTGPHAGYDRYGRLDHYFWRCERCGLETTDGTIRRGCWGCEDRHG